MSTLKDVAERAGVTVTTVSRVINERGYISKKTRKRVHDAMREIGYRPNEVARSLSRKNSNVIGVKLFRAEWFCPWMLWKEKLWNKEKGQIEYREISGV